MDKKGGEQRKLVALRETYRKLNKYKALMSIFSVGEESAFGHSQFLQRSSQPVTYVTISVPTARRIVLDLLLKIKYLSDGYNNPWEFAALIYSVEGGEKKRGDDKPVCLMII